MATDSSTPRVFLSYSQVDQAAASEIAGGLTDAGINVWSDAWSAKPAQDINSEIAQQISSRDTFVIILSRESMSSTSVQQELGSALDRRDIDVVPVVLEEVEVPRQLGARRAVSYASRPEDIESLTRRILEGSRTLDLQTLTPRDFESLIVELLPRYGFDGTAPSSDAGFDLLATYQDKIGLAQPISVIVEIKAYRNTRVSVKELAKLASLVSAHAGTVGLIVTNSHLTSAAYAAIAEWDRQGKTLRSIDAPKLRELLLEQPDLVRKYGLKGGLHR